MSHCKTNEQGSHNRDFVDSIVISGSIEGRGLLVTGGGGGGRWCGDGVGGRELAGEGGSVLCGETESKFEPPSFTGLGGSIGFEGSVCSGLIERRVEECRPGEVSLVWM